MSVKACSRKGCDNILCDRLSDHYGYICTGCFDELVGLGVHTNVQEFMDTRMKHSPKAAYAFFDEVFGD